MTDPIACLVIFLSLMVLGLFLRVPIGIGVGGAGLVTLVIAGLDLSDIPKVTVSALDSFPFLAIPGFVLAGMLMARGGVSAAIVRFADSLIGHFRGSLGAITVVTSTLFGTVTGSSIATIAAVGGFMSPELKKAGYDRGYIAGLLGASGFLGILIPPSVPGILYAVTAGLSIADVWISTVAPALLLVVLFIGINYLSYGRKQQRRPRPALDRYVREVGSATWRVSAAMLMPVLIFGGIYGGIFTPTEAAGVTALYGLIVSLFVYRGIKLNGLWAVARDATLVSAILSVLIAFASIVGRMVALLQIPQELSVRVTEQIGSPLVFLLVCNLILLFVGMFMETNTSILILAPIFSSMAVAMGVDPLHFAAIMLLNLEIGMITPPFAGNLFLSCRLAGVRMDQAIRPLLPFYAAAIAVLALTTLWPDFSTFLPHRL